jgi:putative ubiquitin-RnfH superfamily antitoxin RatB of RatAB toxin-antitoxin module
MAIPEPAMGDSDDTWIEVEVAYALPERQLIKRLHVQSGCTALQAVHLSGIAQEFSGLDPDRADMGIFAKNLDGKTLPVPAEYRLKAGDRVEIYRPLVADPKLARQQRAAKAAKKA